MKRTTVVSLIGLAMFVVGRWNTAFGAQGELDRPAVAILRSVPQAEQDAVRNVLSHKDRKFISGSWLNKSTQIHYKSDTAALGNFLDGLSKCPSATVWVRFYRPGRDAMWAPAGSNWSVFHSAIDNSFSIKIRLDSEIDLTELYIPPLRAERKQHDVTK